MAQHHASPYHDVKHVPMIASPLFKIPSPISPPFDLRPLPDDIRQRRYHDFSLEHRIVQEYQRIVTEENAAMEAKENAYRLYAEERKARLRQEQIIMARKIAPGFLDNEDRRILTPTLATAQTTTNVQENTSARTGRYPDIDFSEFEQTTTSSAPGGITASEIREKEQLKDEVSAQQPWQRGPSDDQRGSSASPSHDSRAVDAAGSRISETTEEFIYEARPLPHLTMMMQNNHIEDDASTSPPRAWTSGLDGSEKVPISPVKAQRLNNHELSEFEQGLGPLAPWDTPVDDMTALQDVYGSTPQRSEFPSHQAVHQQPQPQPPYVYQAQPLPQTAPPFQDQQQHMHSQHPYVSAPNRAGINSSPLPTASSGPPPKPGIAGQAHSLQYFQNRHSTGGTNGAPGTALPAAAQQHSRFGEASPSPPPVPPPPRATTGSPGVGAGSGPGGVSRPPLPARPHRGSVDSPSPTTASSTEHQTITDRSMSMTPPGRPPLPPPPPGLPAGSSTSSSPSPAGGPPMRPRPPIGPNKAPVPGAGPGSPLAMGRNLADDNDLDQHRHQPVAPAPPHANSLIQQLVNMGFTREQSRTALEKYDYDLEKATNHLLDFDD
ncbi:hypothetical protein B0O80DRAFT_492349 [Mortierella sp. GBAus27b]|nr:hypothetical protein B0O80DRAFT_492349 [Mortierella sp. GBAus27b]